MLLPPCPHCGDTGSGVYRNIRAYGWCEEYFSANGRELEIITDPGLKFTSPKKVWCAGCFRPRPDLEAQGNRIIVVEGG